MPQPFVKCYFATYPLRNYCFSGGGAGEELVHKNGYDIALLAAQMEGQMEPGVNSTKDNHTAPKDSMRPQDREALTNPAPADPTAQGDTEAQPTSHSHFLRSASTLQC